MKTLKKLLYASCLLSPVIFAQEVQVCYSLYQCSERGLLVGVQDFYNKGEAIDERNSRTGKTPLMRAVEKGHASVAQFLLLQGADPNARTPSEIREKHVWGQTLEFDFGNVPVLLLAVQNGDGESVRVLLDAHADPNLSSGLKWTPLAEAIEQGRRDLARSLMENGALRENLDWISWIHSWPASLPSRP